MGVTYLDADHSASNVLECFISVCFASDARDCRHQDLQAFKVRFDGGEARLWGEVVEADD